jgi:hypothetical protein
MRLIKVKSHVAMFCASSVQACQNLAAVDSQVVLGRPSDGLSRIPMREAIGKANPEGPLVMLDTELVCKPIV